MRKIITALYGRQKGFTLIELLVVIGILAVLAGVVTLGVVQFIGRGAREAACTELHNVQTAAAACRVEVASGNDNATSCVDEGTLHDNGYLLTEASCSYTIDTEGVVTAQNCTNGEDCTQPESP